MQDQLSFNDVIVHQFSFPGNNLQQRDVTLSVLRLDQLHPLISGNKWYKLRFYIDDARTSGKKHIITFGGAWSNHLLATAALCKMNGLSCTAIVRGEAPATFSHTLIFSQQLGMDLVFVSREAYRDKNIPFPLNNDVDYIIPEGGYGALGAAGATTILQEVTETYTHYCCAAGTGTMLAGLVNATAADQQVTGISVLKNNRSLREEIAALVMRANANWQLLHDFHFGGYAKYDAALINFMNELYAHTQLPTDFVYTGKLFYAVHQLLLRGYFPEKSRVLVIHSGGLQGNYSLDKGTLIF